MDEERKIRVLIVDDEEHARDELHYLLQQYPDLQIVGQAATGSEALELVKQTQPQLVFMDIEMPGENGLQIVEQLVCQDIMPFVIFATAHEQFALKAFEVEAVDYILKPFSSKRLERCVHRVRRLLSKQSVQPCKLAQNWHREQHLPPKGKLALEQNGKLCVIAYDEIVAAWYNEGQITLFTLDKEYQCTMTLQELQTRLPQQQFFRSHRAYLVNLEKIREIIPWFNGTYNLVMDALGTREIPVSRPQAVKLKKFFQF